MGLGWMPLDSHHETWHPSTGSANKCARFDGYTDPKATEKKARIKTGKVSVASFCGKFIELRFFFWLKTWGILFSSSIHRWDSSLQDSFPKKKNTCRFCEEQRPKTYQDTVDGRNPAPVDMENIPLFTGLYTSQVVQDFFHQQYHFPRDWIFWCVPKNLVFVFFVG